MSKKSIDKLFQQKFKDFRELPDDRVWDRIETTLDERKKSRNIIPIWWKLGASAAGLAFLLYLLIPTESNNPELPKITNSEKGVTPSIEKQKESTYPALTEFDNQNKKEEKGSSAIDAPNQSNENTKTEVTSVKATENRASSSQKNEEIRPNRNSTSIISRSGKEPQWTAIEKLDTENPGKHGVEPSISTDIAERTGIADSTGQLAQKATEDKIENNGFQTGKPEINQSPALQNTANSTEAIVAVDTTTTKGKKSIFEALEDDDDPEEVTDMKHDRWSVEPGIAPVYFNAAGDGSSIAPSFVSNSKSGEVSLSYGVLVSYKVGKKWSVRSGLQKSNYGYSTNDISYSSTFGIVSIANIDNINYNTNSENLFVQNQNQGKPIPGMALDATAKNPTRTGKMLQQFGYLEVPMEVNYALMDKKFGINLIGGVSSLFLTDNSVTLESGDRNTELGDANNINSVNFSANIGFGLNYQLVPKVHLNIEPIFKYQLNTFSNTSGSFQPYSIGVYSGVNFKF